jgi:hypothetical protein
LFEQELIMAYTMIGVYDTYARAEAALDELLSRGFARHKLHLGPIEDTPVGREAELRLLEQSDDQTMNRLTLAGFLRTLSGQQDNHGDIYMEAVRRGSYVLLADAENDQEADQAMDVMARHGPVNIDEVSSRWRREGWTRYDPAAAAMTQDEIEFEHSAAPEEKPTSPIHEVQGYPVKDEAAEPAIQTPFPRNEAMRLGVRMFQRGF